VIGESFGAPWQPRYTLTPAVARHLMEIEAARAVVEQIALPPAVESELRRRARVRSTHYSTRIEGNRLTLAEAEQVVACHRLPLHGRERDIGEVRNYWKALLRSKNGRRGGRTSPKTSSDACTPWWSMGEPGRPPTGTDRTRSGIPKPAP
jgi:hypothetical protein